jgi:hypothetical protein
VLTAAWLEGSEHGDRSWAWEHRGPDRNLDRTEPSSQNKSQLRLEPIEKKNRVRRTRGEQAGGQISEHTEKNQAAAGNRPAERMKRDPCHRWQLSRKTKSRKVKHVAAAGDSGKEGNLQRRKHARRRKIKHESSDLS